MGALEILFIIIIIIIVIIIIIIINHITQNLAQKWKNTHI